MPTERVSQAKVAIPHLWRYKWCARWGISLEKQKGLAASSHVHRHACEGYSNGGN